MANTRPILPVLKPHNVNPCKAAPKRGGGAAPPLARRPAIDRHIPFQHVARNPGPSSAASKENHAPLSKTNCQVSRANSKKEAETKMAFQPVTKVPMKTESLRLCAVTIESKAKQDSRETVSKVKDKHLKSNVFLKSDTQRNQKKACSTKPIRNNRTANSQIIQAGKGKNGTNQKLTLISKDQRLVNQDSATLLKHARKIDDVQDESSEIQNSNSSDYQTLDETFTVITEYIPLNKHRLWFLQPQKSSETHVSICQDPQSQKSSDTHGSLCQVFQPQKSSDTFVSWCQDLRFQTEKNKVVQFEDEETDMQDVTAIECLNDTFNETVTEITEFYPYFGFHCQPLPAQTNRLNSPVQDSSVTTEKEHKYANENSRNADKEYWNEGLGNVCVDDPLNETVTFVTEVFEMCGPGHVGRLKEFEVVKVKSSGAREVVSSQQPDILCKNGAAKEGADSNFSSSTSPEHWKQPKNDSCLLLETDRNDPKAHLEKKYDFPASSQKNPANHSNCLEQKWPARTATLNHLQLDKMPSSQSSHSFELQTKIAEFKNQRWNLLQRQNQLASIIEVKNVAEGNKQDGINMSLSTTTAALGANTINGHHFISCQAQSVGNHATEQKSYNTGNFEERKNETQQELKQLTLESHRLQPGQNKQQDQGQQQQVQQPQQQTLQHTIEPATSGTTSQMLSADVDSNRLNSQRVANSETDKVDSYELSDEEWDEFEDDDYIHYRGASGKKIPDWATGVQLQSALIQQAASHQDLQHLFNMDNIPTPDLAQVFSGSWRLRYKLRTSSAMWDPASAPLYKKHI